MASTETKSFTHDSNKITAQPSGTGLGQRRFFFWISVAVVFALVALIEIGSWKQVGRVRETFASLHLESFQLGMRLREGLVRLHGFLFRFQLSEEPSERESFHQEARALSEFIAQTATHLRTEEEKQLAQEVAVAFEKYLAGAAPYLERGLRGIRRDTARQLDEELSARAAPLLALADRLAAAQEKALGAFFSRSQAALASLQVLLLVSALIILVLVASMGVLMYRTLIMPLRHELSRSQDVIERQERLASLGVLAAGVAHEIRNPLTAIKFRLFSLRGALPPEWSQAEDVVVINSEIDRLERIVRDFLQFARPSEPELANVPVEKIFHSAKELLAGEFTKRGLRLEVVDAEPIYVRADKEQIVQVLINLIQNAADSMGQTGTITLRARQGAAALFKRSQPVAILEVIDSGPGIPTDVEKKIFDPFFSTKDGGTGLGLPIAARIVENHGGFIQYMTEPKRGTTFSVVLPKADGVNERAHSTD